MQNVPWKQFIRDMCGKRFAKDMKTEIDNDHVFNGAAALAYYWMLSIFPAAIFLLTLLPYLPIPNLQQAIIDLLRQAAPTESADLFTNVVGDVVSQKRGGLLSFGIVFALWSASTGIYAVMQQLNITYDVEEGRSFWKARGTALLLTLLFLGLVILAFGLVVFGGIIEGRIGSAFSHGPTVLLFFAVLRWIIIFSFLLLGFSMMYYFGPDVEQQFRFITPGSALGVTILVLASLAFRFYVSNFGNYNATYGSLGAVIVWMFWLYIMGLVILLGSEVNAILEHYHPGGKQKGTKDL